MTCAGNSLAFSLLCQTALPHKPARKMGGGVSLAISRFLSQARQHYSLTPDNPRLTLLGRIYNTRRSFNQRGLHRPLHPRRSHQPPRVLCHLPSGTRTFNSQRSKPRSRCRRLSPFQAIPLAFTTLTNQPTTSPSSSPSASQASQHYALRSSTQLRTDIATTSTPFPPSPRTAWSPPPLSAGMNSKSKQSNSSFVICKG